MGVRVLVVEDEQPLGELIQEVLERAGLEAHWVPDGLQARDLLDQYEYDLILMDIIFTRTGGLDLIKWVRERTPEIPIIAMTGYGPETAREALNAGATDAILKPFELARLEELLSRYLPMGKSEDKV